MNHYTDPGDTAPAELAAIHKRLDSGDARMTRIESDLSANTEATKRMATSIAEMVEVFENLKGGFKVFEYLGKLAKPMAAIVALVAAAVGLWTAWKGGPR